MVRGESRDERLKQLGGGGRGVDLEGSCRWVIERSREGKIRGRRSNFLGRREEEEECASGGSG